MTAREAKLLNEMNSTALEVKLGDKLKDVDGRVAATQADSTATDVAGLKTDFNALLAKLKTAGLMK